MKRWLARLGLFMAMVFGALWLLAAMADAQAPEVIGFFIFFAVVIGLGILSARSSKVERTVSMAFRAYFSILLKLGLTLAPVMVFHWFATRVVEGLPVVLQATALLFWGGCLAVGLFVIGRVERRKAVFERLEVFGSLAPALFSFNILMISILFFATASHLLVDQGQLEFIPTGGRFPSNGALADFYLWHFMDSVPLLDVNETLRWEVPFTYESASIGWILLLFKFAVIVPVVGAFGGYWKHRQEGVEAPAEPPAAG